MTQLSHFQPVQGEPDLLLQLFLARPTWLPEARPVDAEHWAMTVHGGGLPRQVTARVAPPRPTGQGAWRTLFWEPTHPLREDELTSEPSGQRWLPRFEGELGLHIAGATTSLVLDGHYDPPGGRLGAVLDEVALHRVARRTVQRLLGDIAGELHERALRLDAAVEGEGDGGGGREDGDGAEDGDDAAGPQA